MKKQIRELSGNEFIYQKYYTRMFVILPVVLLLPTIESNILPDIPEGIFYILSAIVTIILAFGYYKVSGKLFERVGRVFFEEEEIRIERNQIKIIKYKDMKQCTLKKRDLYGISFGLLEIEYMENGFEKIYTIVSEDLKEKKVETCSLWNLYHRLNELIGDSGQVNDVK